MQRTDLLRTFFLVLLIGLLAGCDLVAQRSQLSVSWMPKVADRSVMMNRAAITETYPGLSVIWLRISSESFTTEYINREFNDDRFNMNDDGDALIIEDTEVALNVPTSEPLTIELIAFNTDGYRVFRASKELTTASLSSPVINVDLPLQVDIDENIPVLSSDTGCTDSDQDNLCDVYEDLFLNAAGQPDVDYDGTINSLDTDSDNDGFNDDVDLNTSVSGTGPTPSTNGYPMFVQANTAPVLPDTTVTTLENQTLTLVLDPLEIDPDVNDELSITVSFAGSYGTATVNGTTVTYEPMSGYVGSDTFVLAINDLFSDQGIFTTFTINILDDPAINTTPNANAIPERDSTAGVGLVIDVLSDVFDPEVERGSGDFLTLTSVSSDQGSAYLSKNQDLIYFISDVNDSDAATISFTVEDSAGASASGSVLVWLNNIDNDKDGLGATVNTNGAISEGEEKDVNPISDANFVSDFHQAFARFPNYALSVGEWTDVTENITTDTVWSLEGSPYVVADQEILIDGDIELRIEAGVEVKFKGAASQLTVSSGAQLSVIGGDSSVQSVRFTSINDDYRQKLPDSTGTAAAGDWQGIRLNTAGRVLIYNADIQYAVSGLSIENGTPLIDGAEITQSSGSAVVVNTAEGFTLQDSVIAANQQGMQVTQLGVDSDITNVVIRDNRGGDVNGNGGALSLDASLVGRLGLTNALVLFNESDTTGFGGAIYVGDNSRLALEGNTVYGNRAFTGGDGAGIYVSSGTGTLRLYDTLFLNNDSCGDGCIDDLTVGGGVPIIDSTTYTGNGSDSGNSNIPQLSVNLFGVSPYLDDAWYIDQAVDISSGLPLSPLINSGSADLTVAVPSYLARLPSATTSKTGAADTGQVDIGFHHSAAYEAFDQAQTSISRDFFEYDVSEVIEYELLVSPRTSARKPISAIADVYMSAVGGIIYRDSMIGYTGEPFEYIGGGQYRLIFSMPVDNCSNGELATATVFVDGIAAGSIDFSFSSTTCDG